MKSGYCNCGELMINGHWWLLMLKNDDGLMANSRWLNDSWLMVDCLLTMVDNGSLTGHSGLANNELL